MKYFYDCEFLEDGKTIELISIGIVAGDGREYYAVNSEMPVDRIKAHDWLMENVVPTLPGEQPQTPLGGAGKGNPWYWTLDTKNSCVKPTFVIANEVRDFILLAPPYQQEEPELWAYYGAYDHVVLCQLFGTMIDLPKGMPMFTHELQQLWEQAGRPEGPLLEGEHNALDDARWNRDLYRMLTK